ncbi:hypothetical protein O181_027347 [Austropuccinia psidii MF-1]|uniref:Uncharacterized protein n=1 Tax=Austropuccinia psidii MF-1 TaxID=1389203 RepID=A0A9Q3H1L8_9BASI|nr:hypothetical protein [Austropuccinia psidii MF-1]
MAIDPGKSHLDPKSEGTQNEHGRHFPSRLQPWPLAVTFIKGLPPNIRETPNFNSNWTHLAGTKDAISKEYFSVIQSCNPWRLPEEHSRSPTTWPCRSWVLLSFRILPREISRVHQELNQLSRHQVLQYPLDNSMCPYRLYSSRLYDLSHFGPIHIPLWEFHHTAKFSRWHDLY